VPEVVHAVVEQAQAETAGRVLGAAWDLTWDKVLHLIFLPLLEATRPWQLRYTLGSGLLGICQTAYRFETIQRVLGELAHARVGTPLRYGLCRVWVETLVGPKLPLHVYIDVHLKPHWTQIFMPCGHVAMLNRVMPCTRQIIVTNPQGYVWEILDQVGDAHLSHALPAMEQELEQVTRHPVTLTIVDREANGLEVAQMYAKSRHFALLTLLDDPVAEALIFGTPEASEIFRLTGRWQPLTSEPGMSLAPAVWGSARTEPADARVFSPQAGARGRHQQPARRLQFEPTGDGLRPGCCGFVAWERGARGLSGALAGHGRGDPPDGRRGELERELRLRGV